MNKKSNIFVNIARTLSIAFDRSKEPHCVCPISKCPKITVFMDARESSARDCAAAVTEFFSKYKVSLKLFALDAEKGSAPKPIEGAQMLLYKDLKWFGRPKRSKKHPVVDGNEDLFINLCAQDNFTAHYCAVCSKAHFKIGICSGHSQLYDILVSNTENYTQKQIFLQISSIIRTIV